MVVNIKLSIVLLGWVMLMPVINLAQNNEKKETLSLKKAVGQAMKNNHGIQVARNKASISKNSVSIGNAGMLPSLQISSGGSYNNQNTSQQFEEPIGQQEISGAESNSIDASLDMNYTLFDGLGNQYNYDQLKAEKNLTDAEARQTIEGTLLNVVNQYYQVARAKSQLLIAEEAVQLSKERLKRVENQREYGNQSKVDVLNANVALDADSSSLIEAKTKHENAKRSLNVLLGKEVEARFAVDQEVTVRENINQDEILKNAKQNNAGIQAANHRVKVARLQHKMAKANFLPELNLNSSYDYSKRNQDAGFLNESQSNGFSAGLQLNIPIFAGFQNKIRAENAAIRVKNRKHQLDNTRLKVTRDLRNAYANYEQNLKILRMEKSNVENARLNLERTRESYQVGQVNATQVREAQVNFIRAKNRRTNARYDAKLAEVELFKIAGLLLEEF